MNWAKSNHLFTLMLAASIYALTLPAFQASAATKLSVKTVYYAVKGNTPASMISYILRNGPHGERGRAMGTTTAKISQHVDLKTKGKGCAMRRHRLDVTITMRVPKLAGGQKLSASTRSLFNGLASYVRAHENHHKLVFIQCAKRVDLKVAAIRLGQSCGAVRAQIKRIFNAENTKCNAIHNAYDKREAVRVRKLPFIRKAVGPQTPVRRTAAKRTTTTRRRTTSLQVESAIK